MQHSLVANAWLGRLIGDRYRIESVLGRGGMGVVYSAAHVFTGRQVALKLISAQCEDPERARVRFLNEARTAAAVRHPHVVDVLDMGIHEDMPYLVMEHLEGRSLERELAARGRLSLEHTLNILLPMIGALAALHGAGIVHRDVKPANILLSIGPSGVVPKLLDFGLARGDDDVRVTRSGAVFGTPLYMAAEHVAGERVGPQADVYSLCMVLYECISGQTPYASLEPRALVAQVLSGRTRPLKIACPEVPDALAQVIDQGLRRDLGQRWASMLDLARALARAAKASGIRLPERLDPAGLSDLPLWSAGEALAARAQGEPRPFESGCERGAGPSPAGASCSVEGAGGVTAQLRRLHDKSPAGHAVWLLRARSWLAASFLIAASAVMVSWLLASSPVHSARPAVVQPSSGARAPLASSASSAPAPPPRAVEPSVPAKLPGAVELPSGGHLQTEQAPERLPRGRELGRPRRTRPKPRVGLATEWK